MVLRIENPEERYPNSRYIKIGEELCHILVWPLEINYQKYSNGDFSMSIQYTKRWKKDEKVRYYERMFGRLHYRFTEDEITYRYNDMARFVRKPKYYERLLNTYAVEIFETCYDMLTDIYVNQKDNEQKLYYTVFEYIEEKLNV